MRRFMSVSMTALLLALAGCSKGPPQDLRGPQPEVGQVIRDELKVTMTDGKVTITVDGQSVTGKATLTASSVHEEQVLAVAEGEITYSRTRVVTDQATQTITLDGESNTHKERNPLEGEVVDCEKAGQVWKITLVRKTPTAEQAAELKRFPPPVSTADFYPAEPVKPGHSWTVDVTRLRKLFGNAVDIEDGSCKMTFVKTIVVDGEQCALIDEEMELRGRMKDEKDPDGQFQFKGRGTTRLSLTRRNTSAKYTGTMTESHTIEEMGQRARMTISGQVEMEMIARRE